jgi:hypothetical protein
VTLPSGGGGGHFLWARICKRLMSPGIDSKESIPPAYVAGRASRSNRVDWLNRFQGSWNVYKFGFWCTLGRRKHWGGKYRLRRLYITNPRISWEIHKMMVRGVAFLFPPPQPLSGRETFRQIFKDDHLGYLLHGQQLPKDCTFYHRLDTVVYPWLGKPMLMFCGGLVVWLGGRPMLIFWGGFCPPFRPPKPFYICKASQSRQSDKLFLQLSELGLPQPLARRQVCAPPFGEGHTRWRERGWESSNSDEGTYTVVLFI